MFKRGNKRGQVTLFIIIAIVVVALGVLAWIFWPNIQETFMSEADANAYLADQAPNVQSAVAFCVKSTSEETFRQMGLHAGYYEASNLYAIDFSGPKYVIMYKDSAKARVNKLPSLSEMSNEYSNALDTEGYAKIDSCLNNFADFEKKIDVQPGERKITSDIQGDKIVLKTDWPITISKGKATSTLPQPDIELAIPLGNMWRVANDIVNSEVQQIPFQDLT
jgi:hypothetical protein